MKYVCVSTFTFQILILGQINAYNLSYKSHSLAVFSERLFEKKDSLKNTAILSQEVAVSTTLSKHHDNALIVYLLTFCEVFCMRMQPMQPMTVLCLHNRGVNPSVFNVQEKVFLNGFCLKGLSHEIDFKNFDKKLHNLA